MTALIKEEDYLQSRNLETPSYSSKFLKFISKCTPILATAAKIGAVGLIAFAGLSMIYPNEGNHEYQPIGPSSELFETSSNVSNLSFPISTSCSVDGSENPFLPEDQTFFPSTGPSWLYDSVKGFRDFKALCNKQSVSVSDIDAFDFLSTGLEEPPYLDKFLKYHMSTAVELYKLKDSKGESIFSNIGEVYHLFDSFVQPSYMARIFGLDVFDEHTINQKCNEIAHLIDAGYSAKQIKNFLTWKNKVTDLAAKMNPLLPIKERTELLEDIFSSLMNGIEKDLSQHRTIIVKPHVIDGFGDILLSIKLSKTIHDHFPNIEIILMLEEKHVPLAQFFCKDEFPEIAAIIKPFNPSEKADIQIVCPDPVNEWVPGAAKVGIYEYGCKACHDYIYPESTHHVSIQYVAGLGEEKDSSDLPRGKEIGIFVPPKMTTAITQTLADLHHEGLRKSLLQENSVEEYNKTHSLYFGYCHQIKLALEFMDIVSIGADPSKDIDICLAGLDMSAELFSDFEDSLIKSLDEYMLDMPLSSFNDIKELLINDLHFIDGEMNLEKELKQLFTLKKDLAIETDLRAQKKIREDMSEIIHWHITDRLDFYKSPNLFSLHVFLNLKQFQAQNIGRIDIDGRTYLTGIESQRTLRFISAPRLEHRDMNIMNSVSHPFSITTGDQSISDILISSPDTNLQKIFIYEPLMHKRKFFKDLVALSQPYGKAGQFFKNVMEQDSVQIGILLRDNLPELTRDFSRFVEHIRENHNIETFLVPLIEKILHLGRWYAILSDDAAKLEFSDDVSRFRYSITDPPNQFKTHMEQLLEEIIDTCPATV